MQVTCIGRNPCKQDWLSVGGNTQAQLVGFGGEVSRWLRGEAIPEQDKLVVLAGILKIEPQVLRFGEEVRHAIQQQKQRWDEGIGYLERETFDAFLKLPTPQRKLIREVILTFAKVHGESDASSVKS